MARCETCGNDFDHSFEVVMHGRSYTFDCFECAIKILAPVCAHCRRAITGHCVEANHEMYCSTDCAQSSGGGTRIETAARVTTVTVLQT